MIGGAFATSSIPTKKVDLLTIGDSFTYGYLASKRNTWPSIVGRETDLTVYNVSMGGWGPSQYLCAMKVYAATLKPKFVVIGFYPGNDIMQAATENYPCNELNPDRISAGSEGYEITDGRPLEGIRTWLSHHSVLYQMVKTGFNATAWSSKISTYGKQDIFVDSSTGTTVALQLYPQDDARFQKGVANAIELLTEIKRECERIAAICLTVLIPSKESIYKPLLSNAIPPNIVAGLEQVWRNEQFASKEIEAAFAHTDIFIINSERDLQNTIRAGNSIYPGSTDPHFTSKGYEVIGDLVSTQLKARLAGHAVAAAR